MGTRRALAPLVVLLGTAALLAACGSGAGTAPAGSTAAASTGASTGASTAKPAGQPAEGAAPWPAPPNPLELTKEAGLEPERKESLIFHVHAHLDVFVDGKPVTVPAGIGINTADPGVQHGTLEDGSEAYGGIELCDQPCISPVHTHDDSGVVHTESAFHRLNHLGQFFTEWGVRLDADCVGGYCKPDTSVAVYVDGEPYERDPADIELEDGREIAIVIGTPPAEIPKSWNPA
jgi:hypothetical protein